MWDIREKEEPRNDQVDVVDETRTTGAGAHLGGNKSDMLVKLLDTSIL